MRFKPGFLCRRSEGWYPIALAFRVPFETISASNLYNTDYLTELEADAPLATMLKSTMIDLQWIVKHTAHVRLYHVVERERSCALYLDRITVVLLRDQCG